MTEEDLPLDLSIIDKETLKKIQGKKARADRIKQIISENGLENDKEFMDEINPLIEELLKEETEIEI